MEISQPSRKIFFFSLCGFFTISTASIFLENFIWAPVLYLLVLHLKGRQSREKAWDPFLFWTLLWIFSFYLGALLGIDPAHSFQSVHRYLTILLILFVGGMGQEAVDIRKILSYFTWGSAICAVYGIWKHFYLHQDRIDSFSGDKMVFGGLLMLALLIQIGFLMRQPKDLLTWVLSFLNGSALLFTETRGAWVGFLAGFILLAIRFNRRWLGLGFLIMVAGYFFMPDYLKEKMKSITQVKTSYNEKHEIVYSDQARFYVWNTGLKIIHDHPLGIGQGNLEEIYPKYRNPNFIETNEPHLHNNFLQITAQNGYLGLVIFLGWILAYGWGVFTFKTEDPMTGDLNWIMTCCFAGALAWGLTEYTFAQQFMYLQFSLIGLQWGLWKKGILSQSNNA